MNLIQILFENDEILVINKPSGLAVQGGVNISHSLDKDFSEQLGYKIYLVHRLDKETCGLMIVAKNPISASKWTKLISSKIVKKEYIAYCVGSLKKDKGVITEEVVQHGITKKAITNYYVEEKKQIKLLDQDITISKIRLLLETGRMHQIRIHLAKNNCPIILDEQHGNFKLNKLIKKELKIKKMQLFSAKLTIPLENKEKTFTLASDYELIF